MTPWNTPQERALNWLLSPNSDATRIPYADPNHRKGRANTAPKAHLVGRYYIQRIYDSKLFLVSWCDDYGRAHESRLDHGQVTAWLERTQGTRPPNAADESDMLSVQEIVQTYGVTEDTVRGFLNRLDDRTLTQNTSRAKGNHWLVSKSLARLMFYDQRTGRPRHVNIDTFKPASDDMIQLYRVEWEYNVTYANALKFTQTYRGKLLARGLVAYGDMGNNNKPMILINRDLVECKWGKLSKFQSR